MLRPGYTLVEILISVTLSLFLLLGVTELFRSVGTSISDTQATLNMTRNLHWVALTLRNDLANLTEDVNKPSKLNGMSPPGDTGYFEIIEGQNVTYSTGAAATPTASTTHVSSTMVFRADAIGSDYDNTVGDVDDILMFTARSSPEAPFRGLVDGRMEESTTAEIIWFMRGNTLYRRQLLVLENGQQMNPTGRDSYPVGSTAAAGFYIGNDVSVRVKRNPAGAAIPSGNPYVIANTLQDLSRRENRYGHGSEYGSSWANSTYSTVATYQHYNPFPHPIYYANTRDDTRPWYYLRMPTMEECVTVAGMLPTEWAAGMPLMKSQHPVANNTSFNGWLTSSSSYPHTNSTNRFSYHSNPNAPGGSMRYWDFWENPNGWDAQDKKSGSVTFLVPPGTNPRQPRAGEDIIMTNVISFDVKVWNPYWVPLMGATSTSTDHWAPPQHVDLGQDRMLDPTTNTMSDVQYGYGSWPSYPSSLTVGPPSNRFGFCSKGKYADARENVVTNVTTNPGGLPATIAKASWRSLFGSNHYPLMPSVYDTWTREYEKKPYLALQKNGVGVIVCDRTGTGADGEDNPGDGDLVADNWEEWECPPPYITPLKGVEITIRCFDPRGKNIKQIRIVKDF